MHRLTRFAAVLVLPFVLAVSAAAPAERIAPEGIDGTLLLCGDKTPDQALDAFCNAAGKEKAALAILISGEKSDRDVGEKLAEALKARKPATVAVVPMDAKDPKGLEALRNATGVWIVSGADAAAPELSGAMKRGAVAASGAMVRSLHLLPGVVVESNFSGAGLEDLFAALDKSPGTFGVGVGEGMALVVHGRRMTAIGDGAVTILLAKSAARPRRVMDLTEKAPSDYTMLRRAAIARAGAPFPPKERVTPEVAKGSLVIVGGGGMPTDVTKKFIELAGGPDALIVVLPTASPAPSDESGFFRKAGAKNVVSLPAAKLEEVEDPKTLDVLRKADAIWFGGGRQWHFVDVYEGTKAEELFHDVLRRGGVIGGSSAGATIQGGYLCRGSALNNTEEMAEGYERGFAFLPGVAIDQHFTQRNRFADMTSLMKAYPQLLGIGLDEATAIVVKGHEAEVMGKGTAHFYDGRKPAEGQPDYDSVKAAGRYDLKERKVLDAGEGR
ncbi:MAG TPA: Type 1 glutamine amidotransferase-like domain-containing protein [Gemmataceae bacterium]|nr:Type 1 glutamine amidotransferase-like domain-containing protein [Gemmataceae bacterium]